MYPYNFDTAVVKNRWYIAAFSNEITREPIERTFMGKPVALYRKEDGSPVAMYGLCPHRYFPLAQGKVEGDALKCGYHGFTFDSDGTCIRIPSQDVAGKFCQPTYPIVERGPLCWIWMGDADKSDEVAIPSYEDFGLDQPGWRYSSANYFHSKARAQLMIDNLMDLTHLAYIHHHVPGGDSMAKTAIETLDREQSYQILRKGKVPFNPFFEMIFGAEAAFDGVSDFTTVCDFYGPEFIRTGLPIMTDLELGKPVPDGLNELYILHGMTPETEHSTHYFGFATRNFKLEDDTLDNAWLASDNKIRQQDVDATNAVEERLEYGARNQKELLVVADRPAVKVRKLIEAMLAKENDPKTADA
ncbi:MAG: Rieske 2Fe-2S domain-containing protein [Gammaproteobacteria bacterium]